jgi:hypothetical protein
MKPAPASSFVVAQAQFLLEVLVVALDAPAHLGFEDHALQRHVLRQRGQPVLHRLAVTFGPLDENPLLRTHLRALVIAMGRVHPNPGEARAQREVGACSPFECLPLRGLLRCPPADGRPAPAQPDGKAQTASGDNAFASGLAIRRFIAQAGRKARLPSTDAFELEANHSKCCVCQDRFVCGSTGRSSGHPTAGRLRRRVYLPSVAAGC